MKKIIDSNGRLFGKVSVIDLLAVAVVAVLAVALYVKNTSLEHTSTGVVNDTITYQMAIFGVYDYVGEAIAPGDLLYDKDRSSGGTLGTITQVELQPGTKLAEFADGTAGYAPMEDGVNILLTIEGSGIVRDGRVLLNRVYELGVNSRRNYYTPYAEFVGFITDIQY